MAEGYITTLLTTVNAKRTSTQNHTTCVVFIPAALS
jgi:hypothetical protein